jgi:hypothetical protein
MSAWRMMRKVLRHPNDFYYDLQAPGMARWSHAILLILLAFAARMISILVTGYAFTTREAHEISFVYEFIWISVPWITWSVSNWAVSTILDGEGKFKEIAVGSAYALVPYIVFIVPVTMLTNLLSLDESSAYELLLSAIFVWVILLMLIKVKTLHDFEIGKVFWITVLTLIGVFIIWFVGIILYGLIDEFVQFIFNLFQEINFRM